MGVTIHVRLSNIMIMVFVTVKVNGGINYRSDTIGRIVNNDMFAARWCFVARGGSSLLGITKGGHSYYYRTMISQYR